MGRHKRICIDTSRGILENRELEKPCIDTSGHASIHKFENKGMGRCKGIMDRCKRVMHRHIIRMCRHILNKI